MAQGEDFYKNWQRGDKKVNPARAKFLNKESENSCLSTIP
jgi:hypothetical protein